MVDITKRGVTVRDLLSLMFEDEPVEIVSDRMLHKCSGCFRVKEMDFLSPGILDCIVIRVWRSVYERIIIVIE